VTWGAYIGRDDADPGPRVTSPTSAGRCVSSCRLGGREEKQGSAPESPKSAQVLGDPEREPPERALHRRRRNRRGHGVERKETLRTRAPGTKGISRNKGGVAGIYGPQGRRLSGDTPRTEPQ
jgi:hypothetical protein